jgi:hypothetical protein
MSMCHPGGAGVEGAETVSTPPDPLLYPWDPPETSGVMVGSDFLPLQLTAGRELGESPLLASVDMSSFRCLDEALAEANVAPLDSRSAVVSIGSNSSPNVLRRKFAQYPQPVSGVLPLIRGELHHVAVGHSAHVSQGGYIAATPYPEKGECTTVWVSWLDERQLMALDETEPNYRRIQLDGGACPLVLANGERPVALSLYESRWGVLTDGDGGALPFMDQPALFRVLAGGGAGEFVGSVFEGPPELVAGQLGTSAVQAWARDWFPAAGLVAQVCFDSVPEPG